MAFDDIDWSQPQQSPNPDMIPGLPTGPTAAPDAPKKPPPTLMDSAWSSVGEAGKRIADAATTAAAETKPFFTPAAAETLRQDLPLNLGYTANALDWLGTKARAGVNAIGAGLGATAGEVAGAIGGPSLRRDMAFALPAVTTALATTPGNLYPRLEPEGAPTVAGPRSPTAPPAGAPPGAPSLTTSSVGLLGQIKDTGEPYVRPPPTPPTTSRGLFDIGSGYYNLPGTSTNTLTPDFVDKAVDAITKRVTPQDPVAQKFVQPSAVTKTLADMQDWKGQPITLDGVNSIDQELSRRVNSEFNRGNGTLTPDGETLLEMQHELRDRVGNATADDTTGGNAGFAALKPARDAWAAGKRMELVEGIANRAATADNAQTSLTAQIKRVTQNPSLMRGWSDEEIDALKKAGETGVLDPVYRAIGGHIGPAVAQGVATATGGIIPGLGTRMMAEAATDPFRQALNRMAVNRLQGALSTLAQRAPPPAWYTGYQAP